MKRGKAKTSLKSSKNVKIVIGIFALILISAIFVYASAVSGGYRVAKNYGSEEIDAHGICKVVTNRNPSYDLFVPTNKSAEWVAFRASPSSYAYLEDCYAEPSCELCTEWDSWSSSCEPISCSQCYSCDSSSGACSIYNPTSVCSDTWLKCTNNCPSDCWADFDDCYTEKEGDYSYCMESCMVNEIEEVCNTQCGGGPNYTECDQEKEVCDSCSDQCTDAYNSCYEDCPSFGGDYCSTHPQHALC